MTSQHHKQIEEKLFAVLVDDGPGVVHAKEDDVEHQGQVDTPVHAVTVQVQPVHHQLGEQDHGQVAPVEVGDGDRGVGQELGEGREPPSELGHGERMEASVIRAVGHLGLPVLGEVSAGQTGLL